MDDLTCFYLFAIRRVKLIILEKNDRLHFALPKVGIQDKIILRSK